MEYKNTKIVSNEIRKIHEKLMDIVYSRLPEAGMEDMDINDYIASISNLMNSPLLEKHHKKGLEKMLEFYAHLRDTDLKEEKEKTFGKIRELLNKGKIDPRAIKYYIDEEAMFDFNAAIKGYSQYKNEINKLKDRYGDIDSIMDDIKKKTNEITDKLEEVDYFPIFHKLETNDKGEWELKPRIKKTPDGKAWELDDVIYEDIEFVEDDLSNQDEEENFPDY